MARCIHTFMETDRIAEPLCIRFYETCLSLQQDKEVRGGVTRVSYKELMREMHMGRERFQRLLNCIGTNDIYFKIERGYILETSNIVATIDWSRRFTYQNRPIYHFYVKRFYNADT